MSTENFSLEDQFLSLTTHHALYPAIDPAEALKGSASGKVSFLSGASQDIGWATAVAFARAGAAAVYITARSAQGLEETKSNVLKANPDTKCEYRLCDVTDEQQARPPGRRACFGGRVYRLACSGRADRAKGRYLSSNWDVAELGALKDRILQNDLLVNRLRAKACGV